MRIAVFGAGAWGTALAIHAARRHPVMLWTRDPAQALEIREARRNRRYLPEAALPDGIEASADIDQACEWLGDGPGALAVLATSVAGMRPVLGQLSGRLRPGVAGLVWLCKGIERETGSLPHLVAAEALPGHGHAVLSGPSFAQEVAAGLPVALTVASRSEFLRRAVQQALHHGAARIYGSDDVIGVELGGALKNVMAIAAGACDGLKLGHNARAALITRGLAETARLGMALGARAGTFTGLTGLGDLVLTCTGELSRNRRVGMELGKGRTLQEILADMKQVAEGVKTATSARDLSKKFGVELPICEQTYCMIHEGKNPRQATVELMTRQPRSEF